MHSPSYSVGPAQAGGAVTVDFAIPASLPPDQVVLAIERDRRHMAKRPGFRQKHLPVRVDSDSVLKQEWVEIYADAKRRGLSSVWLLHNEHEQLAGLITMADRASADGLRQVDAETLQVFETSASLGARFDRMAKKEFDRTSWVLTIWFPIAEGKPDVPPVWPNSPPLPAAAYAMGAATAE
jgi:hypothetical protein